MVKINKKVFLSLYKGLSVSHYSNIFYTLPKDELELRICMSSKLWRLNNLYTISNKKGQTIRFEMNMAQHKVYAYSLRHPRLIILKSRQQGISTLWLISFFDDCIFNSNIRSGLMSQGLDESSALLTNTKLLWDNLDPYVKEGLKISIEKDSAKKFEFSNGSRIFIQASFRGSTLQRLHVSEFGKIANRDGKQIDELITGTLQTIASGNTVVIESTAEGDNKFKTMWETSELSKSQNAPENFYPVFLSWTEDPDCSYTTDREINLDTEEYFKKLEKIIGVSLNKKQKNFWIAKREELGTSIYQEYPATPEEAFAKSRDGAYYAHLYLTHVRDKGRELEGLYDKNLPVKIAVDLGYNDTFVMVFFQHYVDGFRILDCYENNGEIISHYCDVIKRLIKERGYEVDEILLPHDAHVTNLNNGEDREQAFHNEGFTNTTVVEKTNSVNNDIQIVREAIKNMWIDLQAVSIIKCFINYSKEYDSKLNVWKDKPRHDEYSHGADAIRLMIVGSDNYVKPKKYVPVKRNILGFQKRTY